MKNGKFYLAMYEGTLILYFGDEPPMFVKGEGYGGHATCNPVMGSNYDDLMVDPCCFENILKNGDCIELTSFRKNNP